MNNKVLLILVDGMRPDSIPACGDANFEKYYRSGTYCMNTRTTYPSVTLPCHMSLFHSVEAERHGILSNTFVPQNHPIEGLVERVYGAGKTTAFFYTWAELRDLCLPGKALNYSWYLSYGEYHDRCNVDRMATEAAEAHIRDFAPDFAFLYLGATDEVGHKHGWMTDHYLAAVKNAWDCIDHITQALPEEYSVIVTADHGGHGRSHGDNVPEDMTIPVTCHGRPFQRGKELSSLSIIDLAPTIADVLGVKPAQDWEGVSILRREM